MGNVHMEAKDINYRGGNKKMSVEEALKNTSGEAAAIAQLQQDVSDLNDVKANKITIAPTFSAEVAYDPGDLVYYNGLTYRCVNAHEGEWDADDFAATTIANELSTLMSGLTNVSTGTFAAETGVTIVSSSLKKSVNTVTFIAVLQKVMVLNENNLMGILPVGFRPSHTIITMAYNDTKECPIKMQLSSSSGGLYITATSDTADAAAQNIYVYVTYVVN